MTALQPAPAPALDPAETLPAPRLGLLHKLGGVCLAAGPLMFVAGIVTAPHQDVATSESFVASLVDNPAQAELSATLLHYSWFGFAFGLLALIGLVPGRRGKALTAIPAVLGAIGAIQISGLLLGDLFVVSIGRHTSVADAVAIQDDLGLSALVWMYSAQALAMLPPVVALVGLARARVLSWAVLPALLLFPAAMMLPLPMPLMAVLLIAAWLPAYVAARHLVTGAVPERALTATR